MGGAGRERASGEGESLLVVVGEVPPAEVDRGGGGVEDSDGLGFGRGADGIDERGHDPYRFLVVARSLSAPARSGGRVRIEAGSTRLPWMKSRLAVRGCDGRAVHPLSAGGSSSVREWRKLTSAA